jgi:hypothetical protein
VDCAPIDSEPVTVHLNSVKPDLTMVWAADNTIWLLPAYSFGSADGGIYSVIAVEDQYIQQSDTAILTGQTEPAVVDPGVVPTPETAVAVSPSGAACAAPPPTTDPSAAVEKIADTVVGLCVADAEALAKGFGYEVRVVSLDGVGQAVTDDLRPTRINVVVDNGVVTAVQSIG